MKITKGYKFIQEDMKSKNGNHKWEIGKWYSCDKDKLKLCEYGFHACIEPYETLNFIYGDKFFIVEARGKIIHDKGVNFVASEMRLIKELPASRIFKKFAIWNGKQCVNNYENIFPKDKRVSDCIKIAEDYLDGKVTLDELSAATSAVWSVAWSAESAMSAEPAMSAESAAMSVAWSAMSVAWSAMSAAWSVESAMSAEPVESAAWSEWLEWSKWSAWSVESAAWSAMSAATSAANKYLKKLIKKYGRNTKDNIKLLKEDEIFVFGSNKAGNHAGGAAKLAKDKFKAKTGVGEGLIGQSYAFPTLDKNLKKLDLKKIKKSVEKLNKCAKENPYKIFLLTKVGCGIAGYKENEIKKLFKDTELNIIKPKGW